MLIDDHCTECDGNGYHTDDCPACNQVTCTYEEYEALQQAQVVENNGNGIKCVQVMLKLLQNGDVEQAKNVWQIDGDKLHGYLEVKRLCREIFGCRLHFKHNCDKC